MDDDFIELGETGLIPTSYGFINKETGVKFDHEGQPLDRDFDDTAKND